MFHNALATFSSLVGSLLSDLTGGFVTNRTLFIGFVVALVLAFFAKLALRSHDHRQAERREEQQEVSAITGNGPPTFNG